MSTFFNKIKYLVLVLLIVLGLIYLPSLFNHNGMKVDLESTLTKLSGNNVKINGSVRIATLPTPKVILDQVSLTDEEDVTFDLGILEFDTSFATLMGGELSVDKVKLREGRFFYNDVKKMVLKNLNSASSGNIPEFEVDKITLLFDSKTFDSFDEVNDISGNLAYTGLTGSNLSLDLIYKIEGKPYSLDADLMSFDSSGSADEATLDLASDDYSIRFFGKLDNFFSSPSLNGQATLKFKELDNKSWSSPSIYKMLRDDKYVLTSDINLNKDTLSADNIKIESNSISNASGAFSYSFGENPSFNFQSSIAEFSVDSFVQVEGDENIGKKSLNHLVDNLFTPLLVNFNFNFDDKNSGAINVNVDKVIYNEDAINDVKFNAEFNGGLLLINDFTAKLPGEGTFGVVGSIEHNDIRPKLLGSLEYNVKNFPTFANWLKLDVSDSLLKEGVSMRVQSNISLIPRSIKFEKIRAILGSTKLIGHLGIRKNSDEPISVSSNFRLSEFNLDDFKIPQSVDNFIKALYFYDADKFGRNLTEYVNDYRWLRTYPLETYFDVIVDKVIYKGQSFRNIHFSSKLSANNLEVDQFKISNADFNLDGRMKVSVTAIRPIVELTINSKRFDVGKVQSIFPTLTQLHNEYIEAINKNQSLENSAQKALEEERFVNGQGQEEAKAEEANTKIEIPRVFNFLSLHNYDSIFDLNFEQIIGTKYPLKSFKAKGKLVEGIVKIDETNIGLFNGQLKTTGSILISNQLPSFSFSFAFNNFNPEELFLNIYGYQNFKGYMSVSGTMFGNGLTFDALKRRMYGRLRVEAKKINVKGFDLGEIIKTTELPMPYNAKLERLKYYTQYGETVFDDMTGEISFRDGLAEMKGFELENNRSKGRFVGKANFIDGIVNTITRISFIPTGFNAALTLDLSSQGLITKQDFDINVTEVTNFLQNRSGDYQRLLEEEEERKSRSLIRNRRF